MTKKPKTSKKLSVNRQTIRQLSNVDLTQAQGGAGAGIRPAGDTGATCVTPGIPTVGCGPG